MAYLVNQYAPNHCLYPSNPKKRAQIDRLLYFEGTTFYPAMKTYLVQMRQKKDPTPEQTQEVQNVIGDLIAIKAGNKFMTGDEATLSDISLAMSWSLMKLSFAEEVKPLEQWYKDVEIAVPAVKELNDSIDFSIVEAMLKK